MCSLQFKNKIYLKVEILIYTVSTLFNEKGDSYRGAINIVSELCPTIPRGYICNIITAIGHSMNGQAFSKTSESTCIINILEEDLKVLKKDSSFSLVNELYGILFKI